MPTRNPIPVGQVNQPVGLPGNPLNPVDWIDAGSPDTIDGAQQGALMRGHPGALSWWMRRAPRGHDTALALGRGG